MWRKVWEEELRQQMPVYVVIFALLLLSGVLGMIVNGMSQTSVAQTIDVGDTDLHFRGMLSVFSMMGIYLIWLGSLVFFSVYTIYRFAKGGFGRESVLWMTLPVKPWQVLLGKLMTPLVWLVGMLLIAVLWVMIFVVSALFPNGVQVFAAGMSQGGVVVVCMLVAQVLLWMGSIYGICFAITAGHLPRFRRYAFWASVGIAVVLFFVAEPLVALLLQLGFGFTALGVFYGTGLDGGVFYGLIGLLPLLMLLRLGLYAGLTLYLGEKKLDYLG